jgi:hypothetical protein
MAGRRHLRPSARREAEREQPGDGAGYDRFLHTLHTLTPFVDEWLHDRFPGAR